MTLASLLKLFFTVLVTPLNPIFAASFRPVVCGDKVASLRKLSFYRHQLSLLGAILTAAINGEVLQGELLIGSCISMLLMVK